MQRKIARRASRKVRRLRPRYVRWGGMILSKRSLKVYPEPAGASTAGVSFDCADDEKRGNFAKKLGLDEVGVPSHSGTWCAIGSLCTIEHHGRDVKEL